MRRPGVDLVRHPAGATELVLLAHGGEERSKADPHLWRPALLRMWPFAMAARWAAPDAAIGFARYRFRGWNDAGDPAVDLRAVLDELPYERVLLIGHSMGGRAVVAVGDHPRVAGVLALAPWLPPGEPLVALRPPVTFVHGADDTMTDPAATAAYAARLRAAGVLVTTYALAGEGHAMLKRPKDWNRLVTEFVRGDATGGGDEHLPAAGAQVVSAVAEIATTRFRLPVKERFRAEAWG
ncbi:pimeloyl-ACP methyl ester carboxylesterase [Kribbella aluminosa]|uniref:Pimeloyl-ACP methyl ester carboxylesterase n=1 Tax=Kribbella aluminosa TaxID=416017 RepID=A0ABS4UDU5_9ACTN|nr:alpha/beta hydrolase [Kribbella aluminosa]MBP2349788.1 pimeloyl-ACP methyl ester carboxylesterase [Kribbella aluminosa]